MVGLQNPGEITFDEHMYTFTEYIKNNLNVVKASEKNIFFSVRSLKVLENGAGFKKALHNSMRLQ